jgi:nucleoside-diphosphate-sugar epimerase/MoaA/NifB/PqqE/SkfB family radical SAM enzyme
VAVLGATGRLGPAVVRALSGRFTVRGLSRRAPTEDERVEGVAYTTGLRQDAGALRALSDGAQAVVDLLCLAPVDAALLLDALGSVPAPPSHLVLTSSLAEYPLPAGANAEAALGAPGSPRGRALYTARSALESRFAGTVHALILPRLVARLDPAQRERPYLRAAVATGRGLVAHGGAQRQVVAPVEGVAEVISRLLEAPSAVPPGPLNVGPAQGLEVSRMVRALLDGAGLRVPLARHPDPAWQGPHGGGDERLDTTRLRQLLPALPWPDVEETYRALGQWLSRHPSSGRRPLPMLPRALKEPAARRVVDVHLRRAVGRPAPAQAPLEALVDKLSPGFYVDLGRPCNSACIYCAVPPHGDTHGFTPVASVVDVVKAGLAVGCDRAILIGGEPTIHPELPQVLELLRDARVPGPHVVMTNGLRLADQTFVDTLVAGGVGVVHLSVDTADEDTYERLSRTRGSFSRQRQGLVHALSHPQLHTYVYTVLSAVNASGIGAHLSHLSSLAQSLGRPAPTVVLAFPKPLGDALEHQATLALEPAARVRLAQKALALGQSLGVPVGFRNLQPCLARELLPFLVDHYLEDMSVDVRSQRPEPDAHREYLHHPEGCGTCPHRGVCPGVYREDSRRFGTGAWVWEGET